MKPVAWFTVAKIAALLALAAAMGSCSWLNKPAPPACQGDPALMPCPCMNPATPDCPSPPNDDVKKPDGGSR
jgi:hypothetical protein